jgi:hypothetical protein
MIHMNKKMIMTKKVTAGLIFCILIMSINSCKKQPQWTLTTDDTKLVVGIADGQKLSILELSDPINKCNWTKSASNFHLVESIDMDSVQYKTNWVFKSGSIENADGDKLSIIFTNENPAMELTSVWQAREGSGPIRHSMFIKNNSGKTITIYEQESIDLQLTDQKNNAKVFYINDDGSIPDKKGIYHDSLVDGYKKNLEISEDQNWIPFAAIDANNKYGMYIGWEWSIGRINIAKESNTNAIELKAGNGDNFKTDLYPGETFEVPPAFIGAYKGDLDDCGNSLRKYLFNYSIPAMVKNDSGYPKVEWNAFAATGKVQGGWDPVESKYYRLIDDIAPLGIQEVVIDVGWWQMIKAEDDPGLKLRRDRMKQRTASMHKWIKMACSNEPGNGKWQLPELKTDDWQKISLPAMFNTPDLEKFDGIVWYRKTIEITESMQNKELILELGPIDDIDETWYNGTKVGSTSDYSVNRIYKIPARLVKKGKAVIAIRLIDTGGNGGFSGNLNLKSKDQIITLNGEWDMKSSFEFKSIKDYIEPDWEAMGSMGMVANYGDPGHYVTDPIDWPSGMAAAAKYAHDRKIRFGLYDNEAEYLTSDGGISERVRDISFLIKDLKADFYRSDATAGPVLKGTFGKNQRAHYLEDVGYWTTKGLYKVLDSMYKSIPGFLWENCSGGGRIKDYGACKRASKIQNQDRYYPIDARQSFYDATYAMHPIQLASLVGSWAEWQATGSVYEFRSASMGAAYWHPDAPNGDNGGPVWSAKQKEDIKKAISTYKEKIRPLVRNANLYHIFPRPDDLVWDGIEYYDPSVQKGVVFIFKPKSKINSQIIKLKGLNSEIDYKLSFEDNTNNPTTMKGAELMNTGISVSLIGELVSELMFIEKK